MTQLLFLCCGGNNLSVEQVAWEQEYKLALCAGQQNTVSANWNLSLPYPLNMS